ncbi:MAG: GDP-mannose 4,6-dehydratase [Gemmatimonadota bacterium]|nr:GDP-mannose 4,6-dehydratase [Gemmatimonadota bacterium]MDH5760499.1 GDP-mannose 4,6-dehydratase [Gemmatimonadota bacterium]
MRILVTGGAGFIGSHLVERLLERGDEVFVVDDLSAGSLDHLKAVRDHPRLHLNVDTVLNYPMMDETVARVDQVIHLAAAEGVKRVVEHTVESLTNNVRGVEIVLNCCARHGVPLFFASSAEVYGKAVNDLEEDADRLMGRTGEVRWGHAATKALGEALALAYHREEGLPVVIGRIFNVVGPRQTAQWGMVLPTLAAEALKGEAIQVYGGGAQRRCFLHVDDAVEAIIRLLGEDDVAGGVFNIGSEEETSIAELATRVKERVNSPARVEFIARPDADGGKVHDVDRRRPDTTRLREATGWAPTKDLDRMIDDTVEYLRGR